MIWFISFYDFAQLNRNIEIQKAIGINFAESLISKIAYSLQPLQIAASLSNRNRCINPAFS